MVREPTLEIEIQGVSRTKSGCRDRITEEVIRDNSLKLNENYNGLRICNGFESNLEAISSKIVSEQLKKMSFAFRTTAT
jgi:hypothetical protein